MHCIASAFQTIGRTVIFIALLDFTKQVKAALSLICVGIRFRQVVQLRQRPAVAAGNGTIAVQFLQRVAFNALKAGDVVGSPAGGNHIAQTPVLQGVGLHDGIALLNKPADETEFALHLGGSFFFGGGHPQKADLSAFREEGVDGV